MKDYAAERYARDARITTIYEGTSQLQVLAAVRAVSSGAFETWTEAYDAKQFADPQLEALKQKLVDGKRQIMEAVKFIKTQGSSYLDLSGRRLVDSALAVVMGHLLLGQGAVNERKKQVVTRFINREMPVLRTNCEQILSGDTMAMSAYEVLAGPVPVAE
jgi:hypothetical protein